MAATQGGALVTTGHFALAATIKARETTTALWALMLATVWLDVVFGFLFTGGAETLENVPERSLVV